MKKIYWFQTRIPLDISGHLALNKRVGDIQVPNSTVFACYFFLDTQRLSLIFYQEK
jgi:hypothetical protein